MDSRGSYISKILYVKTKESGPLGGRVPGMPLDLPMTCVHALVYTVLMLVQSWLWLAVTTMQVMTYFFKICDDTMIGTRPGLLNWKITMQCCTFLKLSRTVDRTIHFETFVSQNKRIRTLRHLWHSRKSQQPQHGQFINARLHFCTFSSTTFLPANNERHSYVKREQLCTCNKSLTYFLFSFH